MSTVAKANAELSAMMDGELSDAQIDQMLAQMGSDSDLRQSWDVYHAASDAIASDDLAMKMSDDFLSTMSARLAVEPVVLAPNQSMRSEQPIQLATTNAQGWGGRLSGTKISLSLALTSVAATLMLALLMVPQITPLLQGTHSSPSLAKTESGEESPFSTSIKLANNANGNGSGHASLGASMSASTNAGNRDAEFAPRLEDQVEMLRDPRLDSYLLAHQKASPTLDNGGRYIKRANVTASTDNEK